jgi:hypothetical protein
MTRYLRGCILALLAAWFLLTGYHTIHQILDWYSPLPLMDYWRIVQDLPEYSAFHLAPFWRQHNEHRIIFPELVDALDMLLWHGRMVLPLIVSFLCYLGVWGVLVWALYARGVMSWPLREMALLLAAAVMFWPGSGAVLATPFQLQFTLLQASVAVAFAMLAKLKETGRNRYAVALIIAAVVATFSSAQGMLAWPLLLAGAILLRVSVRQCAAIAVCGGAAIGAFLIGYRSTGNLHLAAIFLHFAYTLQFLGAYLGMPFATFFEPEFGMRVGVWAMAVFVVCLLFAVISGRWKTRAGIVLLGAYLYVLASTLLTAAGRMDFTDPQFINAKQARYITVPLAAWGTLIVLVIWLLSQTKLKPLAMPITAVAAIAAFAGLTKAQPFIERAAQDFADTQIAALMLRNNIEDGPNLRTVFPDPQFITQRLPLLREKHLSLYVHGPDKWLGQDLKSLWPFFRPAPGEITRVYPVEGGLEIYGWSDSPYLRLDEHAVLFFDQNGKVAGYGKRPRAGFPLNFGTWNTPAELAFVGFVKVTPAIQTLTAYVWTTPHKTLHRMGEPFTIPNFTPASVETTGPPLEGVVWQPGLGGFHANGVLESVENGASPVGPIYGSWGDGFTGELSSTEFTVPANHCIVLPLIHGASAYGQSVQLRDADTKKVIADLPMFDGGTFWQRWRIQIPAESMRAVVFASDRGEENNQWLALGAPAACR